MSTSTVPMFSPDGTLGDVPFEQMKAALAAGAKPGVSIKSPDGKLGVVPADRYQEAAKAGATIIPFHDQETQHPGFWATAAEDLKGLLHPSGFSPYPGMDQEAKSAAATQAAQQDQTRKEAGYSLPYRAAAPIAQAVGANVPGMEQSAREGDEAGVYGHAAAAAAPVVAAEAIRQGGPAAADALKAKVSPATQAALAAAPDAVGAAVKKLPGSVLRNVPWIGDVLHDMYQAGAEAYRKAQPSGDAGAPLPEHPGTFPGAPEPTASPEQINPSLVSPARSLPGQIGAEQIYGPRPTPALPLPARSGLQLTGEVAPQEAAAAAPPPAATPKTSPAAVQQQLETSLGVEPVNIKPGVTMRNQAAAQGLKLPEGFTPVDSSSVLKGYKYDPATQEFDAITNSGQRFRHAEVTPDQFKAFEEADSKGKAWNDLRNGAGVTPLGKVNENGVLQPRIKPRSVVTDPETGKPEFSDVLDAKQNGGQNSGQNEVQPKAKAAAAGASGATDDLTSLLQQSLDVQPGKGGVFTTADPGELTKRWGVSGSSIADTDANLRGMNLKQSQDYVNKLAESYKNGQPPEPVLETRDAANNIVDVDGRHRALAAQKAGVKRIPVIVRRLGVTAQSSEELAARPQ